MKRFMLVILAMSFAFALASCTDESTPVETEPVEIEEVEEAEETNDNFVVTLDYTYEVDGKNIVITLETNLPDGMLIGVSVENETEGMNDLVTLQDGTGSASIEFQEEISGDYDVYISSAVPSVQPDSVRWIIGPAGDKMAGPLTRYVKNAGWQVVLEDTITF